MKPLAVGYQLRPVNSSDLEQILGILIPEVQHFTNNFDWSPPTLEAITDKWVKGSKRYPWLACITEVNGVEVLAGYAYASSFRDKDSYFLTVETTVYVHPEHHRKGIASALYVELLARLKAMQIKTAIACITMGNEASVKLHEELGFVKTGEIPAAGYKFGRWLDIGFWTLFLQDEQWHPKSTTC